MQIVLFWPDQVEHHRLDAGLSQVLGAAFCVVVQQILHDGYGLLHKLSVCVVDRNLRTGKNGDCISRIINWFIRHLERAKSLVKVSKREWTNQQNDPTHRTLCVKELSDAVPQLVEKHGVQSGAELQTQQVFDIGAHVEPDPVVAAHEQTQQAVQEAADGRLAGRRWGAGWSWSHGIGHVAGAHGDHGVLALAHGAHRWAVSCRAWGATLLETDAAQCTEKARHVDPFLLWLERENLMNTDVQCCRQLQPVRNWKQLKWTEEN